MSDEKNEEKSSSTPYLPIGVGVGIALGVAFGLAMDNLALGIGLGVAIGAGLGTSLTALNSEEAIESTEGEKEEQ